MHSKPHRDHRPESNLFAVARDRHRRAARRFRSKVISLQGPGDLSGHARNMLLSLVHAEAAGALGVAAKVVSRFGSKSVEARLVTRPVRKVVAQILSRAK